MRKSKWTDEQIIGLLQEAETRTPVTEICRRVGLSKETFYRWRKKFGGLQVSDAIGSIVSLYGPVPVDM
jgi:putative transposase